MLTTEQVSILKQYLQVTYFDEIDAVIDLGQKITIYSALLTLLGLANPSKYKGEERSLQGKRQRMAQYNKKSLRVVGIYKDLLAESNLSLIEDFRVNDCLHGLVSFIDKYSLQAENLRAAHLPALLAGVLADEVAPRLKDDGKEKALAEIAYAIKNVNLIELPEDPFLVLQSEISTRLDTLNAVQESSMHMVDGKAIFPTVCMTIKRQPVSAASASVLQIAVVLDGPYPEQEHPALGIDNHFMRIGKRYQKQNMPVQIIDKYDDPIHTLRYVRVRADGFSPKDSAFIAAAQVVLLYSTGDKLKANVSAIKAQLRSPDNTKIDYHRYVATPASADTYFAPIPCASLDEVTSEENAIVRDVKINSADFCRTIFDRAVVQLLLDASWQYNEDCKAILRNNPSMQSHAGVALANPSAAASYANGTMPKTALVVKWADEASSSSDGEEPAPLPAPTQERAARRRGVNLGHKDSCLIM